MSHPAPEPRPTLPTRDTDTPPVPSPCMAQCQIIEVLDPASQQVTEQCQGCGRTLAEITHWQTMGAREKQQCVDAARARKAQRSTGRGA